MWVLGSEPRSSARTASALNPWATSPAPVVVSAPHLLMAETEGLLAPVPVQLKNADQVSNGSDDGQAKHRLDSSS